MSRILVTLLLSLATVACAGIPETGPTETAAVPPAASALRWSVETTEGRLLGSATAFGSGQALTNAHVLIAARGRTLVLRRGDIALAVRSARALPEIDVAVLQIDAPGIAEPALRRAPPVEAEPLFVAGAGTSGVLAGRGRMMAPSTARRFGGGMIAALLPVARGYSGTPVVDAEGRLVGIVAAAVAEDLNTARRLSAVSGNEPPSHWVTLIVPVGTILEGIPMTDRPWSCRPDANAGSCPAT